MLLTRDEGLLALAIARHSISVYLHEGRKPSQGELWVPESGVFSEKRAAFVTLKKDGALRGCIGHIVPIEPLWMSISSNAISAAVRDPRFSPVGEGELGSLKIEISVLTPPVEIEDWRQFIAGEHGIILELGGYSAVFLPQVATEQGWSREETLSYLSLKAGLSPDGWKDPRARFRVFRAQVFGEGCGGSLGACEVSVSS
ncbi:AmmeMemoRadiSam system protein A [bacterium]|nr:MAG: AmmeMemoRadiSam system protein A [bacterium]